MLIEGVEKKILDRVIWLQQDLRNFSEISPYYLLDWTWPSIGIIYLNSLDLWGKKQLNEREQKLVSGIAAYLALLALPCWKSFAEEVRVFDSEHGLVIEAKRGSSLAEGQSHRVEVERVLQEIFLNPQTSFPVFGDFYRPVTIEHDLIGLFALGLVTGLTPFGEGGWNDQSTATFSENILRVVKILATQCAKYYGRLYPDEQLGQVPELYLNGLIFPPTLMAESWPAVGAAGRLVQYFQANQVSKTKMLEVAGNLAVSADELISDVGLVCYAALLEKRPEPLVLGMCDRKGTYCGSLRPAMIEVRKLLGLGEDWIDRKSFSEEDKQRFETELRLGFLPWVKLSSDRLVKKDLQLIELLHALISFDMQGALQVVNRICEETPGDIEIRLQRLYLEILRGEFELAEQGFRSLLTEPEAEDYPMFYNLWGLTDLLRGENEIAVKHFAIGFEKSLPGDLRYFEILNNYAWALIQTGASDQALEMLDLAIRRDSCPVVALLNKGYLMRELGKQEAVTAVQRKLLKIAPLNQRVFSGLVMELRSG